MQRLSERLGKSNKVRKRRDSKRFLLKTTLSHESLFHCFFSAPGSVFGKGERI